MHIFINHAATVETGTLFLLYRAVATPFMFLCFHLVHFFQAVGEGRISMFLAVVRWAVFNIPMLFLLNYLIGMRGLVLTQTLADICTVIVSFIVYRQFEKKSMRLGTET